MHGAERNRYSSLTPQEHPERDVVSLLLAVSAFAVATPALKPQPFRYIIRDLRQDLNPLSPERHIDSFSSLTISSLTMKESKKVRQHEGSLIY